MVTLVLWLQWRHDYNGAMVTWAPWLQWCYGYRGTMVAMVLWLHGHLGYNGAMVTGAPWLQWCYICIGTMVTTVLWLCCCLGHVSTRTLLGTTQKRKYHQGDRLGIQCHPDNLCISVYANKNAEEPYCSSPVSGLHWRQSYTGAKFALAPWLQAWRHNAHRGRTVT